MSLCWCGAGDRPAQLPVRSRLTSIQHIEARSFWFSLFTPGGTDRLRRTGQSAVTVVERSHEQSFRFVEQRCVEKARDVPANFGDGPRGSGRTRRHSELWDCLTEPN